MDKLKLVLIDDQIQGLNTIREIIGNSETIEIVFSSTDALLALDYIKNNSVDAVITDIVMDKMHGIHLASILEKMNVPVIFCSAYENYAYDGFQVNAVDFIKKPAIPSKLFNALEKLNPRIFNSSFENQDFLGSMLAINEHGSATMTLIRFENIYYLRTDGNYVEIFTASKNYMVLIALTTVMKKLPSHEFYRVHRSYAINLKKIIKMKADKIYLEEGHEVPVGSSYYKEFYSLFKDLSINSTSSNSGI